MANMRVKRRKQANISLFSSFFNCRHKNTYLIVNTLYFKMFSNICKRGLRYRKIKHLLGIFVLGVKVYVESNMVSDILKNITL